MTQLTTSNTIINRVLQEVAARATVAGINPNFDTTAAGQSAALFYQPAVNLLLRQQDWEFARGSVFLTGGTGRPIVTNQGQPILTNLRQPILDPMSGLFPIYPWKYAYFYPLDCMKIRSLQPRSWDQLNPQPVRWSMTEELYLGVFVRVILCNVPQAELVYTSNAIPESQWDAIFEETLVRYLASEIVMSLGGRPDFSKQKLMEAGALMQQGGGRDS